MSEIKHLEAGLLWISSFVDCQVFKIKKLCGKTQNSIDIGTKDLREADMRRCLMMAGVVELSSSHPFAQGIEQIACWCRVAQWLACWTQAVPP